jgi:hypothetical protein
MEEILKKLEQIKDAKFVVPEDYRNVKTVFTEIQHEICELYSSQPPENKHNFIQGNLNLLLHVIENVKSELNKQCYLRHQKRCITDRLFNFSSYYEETKEYEGHLSVMNYFNVTDRVKRIIKQQDDFIAVVKNIFAGYLVDFYREPVTLDMALAASGRILCMSDFLIHTDGEGNHDLMNWIKECEPFYSEIYDK